MSSARLPSMSIKDTMAVTSNPLPRQSMCSFSVVVSSSFKYRNANTTSAAPMGTLIRKTYCHPATPMMKPPSAGPMMLPMATTVPSSPSTRPLSSRGKLVTRMAVLMEKTSEAPMPCRMRKRDQLADACRQPAGQRADGEERDARQEQPRFPRVLGQPAENQQQAGVGDEIGGDRPLGPGEVGAEVRGDLVQREVDHVRVQHAHEDRRQDDEQDDVAIFRLFRWRPPDPVGLPRSSRSPVV